MGFLPPFSHEALPDSPSARHAWLWSAMAARIDWCGGSAARVGDGRDVAFSVQMEACSVVDVDAVEAESRPRLSAACSADRLGASLEDMVRNEALVPCG